jgi:hypothetical protein
MHVIRHQDVGMQRHAITAAISFQAFQVGDVIRVVMKDGCAVIATGDHMVEGTGEVKARFAGHALKSTCTVGNKSILMPDPNLLMSISEHRLSNTV